MAKLTVLGVGNILMRDEGIGVRVLERVQRARSWPADVEFIDGGAAGLGLLSIVEEARRLVVFDAADMHLPPGESRRIGPDQVRSDPAGRMSLHDVPLLEIIRLCEQFSRRPEVITILAIQPKAVDYGRELSDELAAAMNRIVAAGVELVEAELKRIGIDLK